MKIRCAKEGSEHKITDEFGEQVSCPICKKVWNTDFEGDETQDSCKHLRFFYFKDDFIDFYGDWDKETFKKSYEHAQEAMINKEGCFYIIDTFKSMKTKEIDEAIYVEFDYAPMCQPLGIWGYKK